MANEQQQQQKQQDPTKKKGFIFAIFPFFPWLLITMIALWQNKALEKISQAASQNAVASNSSIREQLSVCYRQLGINRNVEALTDKQANDFLFDCKEALKRAS